MAAASGAALLIIAAAARLSLPGQPQLYTVACWFGGFVALAVFAVMLSEYFIHARRIYLFISAGFLSGSIMDIWSALSCSVPGKDMTNGLAGYPLWTAGRITLGGLALAGIVLRSSSPLKGRRSIEVTTFVSASILWAALVIFLTAWLPLGRLLSGNVVNALTSTFCAILFIVGALGFSRNSVHHGNRMLAWMTYSFMFATFGQLAVGLQDKPGGPLFAFANVMKIIGYLVPLAGLLAEQTRLQSRMRRQTLELQGLIEAQRAVGLCDDPSACFQKIVDSAASAFDARAACLMLHDRIRNVLECAAYRGLDEETIKGLVFRSGEGCFGSSLHEKATVYLQDISEDPLLAGRLEEAKGIRSVICVPLVSRGEAYGVLGLLFAHGARLTREQMRVLDAFAAQAGLAVEKLQLRGQTLDSVKASEERAKEIETIWEMGQAITAHLDLHALVDTLVDKLKSVMRADACSVLMFEPDTGRLRIMGHRKLQRYHEVDEHVDQCDAVAIAVAKEGKTRAVANVPNSSLCKYAEIAADDGGYHHLLSAPMISQGVPIGAINVFRKGGQPWNQRDERLLTMLGTVVAVGISNAWRYERQKRIAESLQSTFTPKLEPSLPGADIFALYRAGLEESEIGGDFYDLIEIQDLKYAVVIGDVAGKGLDAAVYTGMARYMIQAYSSEDPDPASVVSRVNSALCRYTPASKFVTLVYGILDTTTWQFTYTNAGHEPPFHFSKEEGTVSMLDNTGPAAGALLDAEYSSDTVTLSPGDALVLYTDGATEVRNEGRYLGTEGLEEIVVKELSQDGGDPAERIFERVRSYADGYLRDDVAILLIRRRTPGALF